MGEREVRFWTFVHVLFGRQLCVCTLRLFNDKGNDNRSETVLK